MVMDLAGGGLIISSLLLLSLHLCSSSTDTLNFNRSLTDGEVLVSNGETYTLGFFSLENSSSTTNRYLGIWYTKISFPSFVWVANGDNPINGTSGSLSIDHRGHLVLREGGRNNPTPLWIATGGGGGNSSTATLLDEGNLVLFGGDHGNRTVLWQSFDHLADTIFPNMKFGSPSNRLVRSWKSPEDPATGDWTFEMDENGLPQMTLRDNTGTRRWRIGPWNGIRWNGIHDVSIAFILNTSIVNGSSHTTTSFTWANQNPSATTTMFVQFGGYLVLSTWQSRSGRWADVASFPNEPCDNYGSCGPNGNCDPYYNVGKSECRCLPGFEPKFPDEWDLNDGSGGCRSTRNSTCGNGEGFVKLENAKVPDVTRARLGAGLDLKMCGEECLKDCSCTAYASYDLTSGDGCLMFYGDLMDTRVFNDGGQDLYVRVDAIELAEHMKGLKGHKPKKVLATALTAMGAAIVLGIIIACCLLRRKRKGSRGGTKHVGPATVYDSENENMYEQKDFPVRFFDVNDIFVATGNFSLANKLGQGGFGSVYKGLLADGREVAIKRLSRTSSQGIEEFKNEVRLVSKLQHKNLVRLLGCCIHGEEKMLIYEYLPNKSLDFFIFDKTKASLLDWKTRLDIIIGIARGLMYLHQDSRLKIIHRDLKPSNVLLDDVMNPKISDFGMARLFGEDQTEANTNRVMGTYGYMSPEYAMKGLYSTKSDVFSFGVLTLEIISGMRSNHCYEESLSFSLIDHVWDLWREGTTLGIIDSSIMGESFSVDQMMRCIHIGLLCVQESPTDRPTMSNVVYMLDNATSLPYPKKPAFIIQPKYEDSDSKAVARFALPSINKVSITTMEAR